MCAPAALHTIKTTCYFYIIAVILECCEMMHVAPQGVPLSGLRQLGGLCAKCLSSGATVPRREVVE